MQRSPLGGRGFESFSEDPYLAGAISAATINGIQSKGVGATIKHFVANDQEHERQSSNSIVSERALREIYLMPFQIAQRDAKPMCYMTAYNKLNGLHVSENPRLLKDVLRKEWSFDGMVMSDWFGTYSTSESLQAGLDLEMPGKSYIRGGLITQALGCRKLLMVELDACVRNVLNLVKKVMPLGIPENAHEGTVDTKETSQALRKVAGDGIVLLKNKQDILPLKKDKTVAIIGPNAKFAAISGGGSASLLPYYAVTPYDGIARQAKDVKYSLGAVGYKTLPLASAIAKTNDGKPGFTMRVYLEPPTDKSRKAIDEVYVSNSNIFLMDYKLPLKEQTDVYYIELEGTFTPEESAEYQFSLSVCGTAKLYIDSKLVVDNETHQVFGDSFFGAGTREEIGTAALEKDKPSTVLVQFGTGPTMTFRSPGATAFGAGGLRVGATLKTNPENELDKAVALAKSVDQVVLCMGLNADWESEGYDRAHMDLPPYSDELVKRVCEANPKTVVVVQSGTPVSMPWLPSCSALIQAWYGGNETGNAIADILFGTVNPSGKLPLSFPFRNEDNPAFLNYVNERGRVLYGEDIYIGYRFYEKTKKEVAFPFGHGLSYTTFTYKGLAVADMGANLVISLSVSNVGTVAGAAVVQVYVSQQSPSIARPVKELKGFAKVHLPAGKMQHVNVTVSKKYAASFWDEDRAAWVMEKGKYDVLVGDSSADTPLKGGFQVKETSWWNGL
jgi:beta-glucosidase